MPVTSVRRSTQVLQSLILTVAPHGGQSTARRNAWASMSEGAVLARGRRDALAALVRAQARAERVTAAAR